MRYRIKIVVYYVYATFYRYGWLKSTWILVWPRTAELWKKQFQKLFENLYVSIH